MLYACSYYLVTPSISLQLQSWLLMMIMGKDNNGSTLHFWIKSLIIGLLRKVPLYKLFNSKLGGITQIIWLEVWTKLLDTFWNYL